MFRIKPAGEQTSEFVRKKVVYDTQVRTPVSTRVFFSIPCIHFLPQLTGYLPMFGFLAERQRDAIGIRLQTFQTLLMGSESVNARTGMIESTGRTQRSERVRGEVEHSGSETCAEHPSMSDKPTTSSSLVRIKEVEEDIEQLLRETLIQRRS